jgi:AcrR family transcriptional regulator
MRADAARNRARLLHVAYQTFASEGLSVPVDEIVRRAGVGAGTFYRHFSTKEELFTALVADRLALHRHQARELADRLEPGAAFFEFLDWLVREGGADQGLMEALAGTGFDLGTANPKAEREWLAALQSLLHAAQAAGRVRSDVDVRDLKSLVVGYQAMVRHRADAEAIPRLLTMMHAGLST